MTKIHRITLLVVDDNLDADDVVIGLLTARYDRNMEVAVVAADTIDVTLYPGDPTHALNSTVGKIRHAARAALFPKLHVRVDYDRGLTGSAALPEVTITPPDTVQVELVDRNAEMQLVLSCGDVEIFRAEEEGAWSDDYLATHVYTWYESDEVFDIRNLRDPAVMTMAPAAKKFYITLLNSDNAPPYDKQWRTQDDLIKLMYYIDHGWLTADGLHD